jgi:hypothetical protein
VPLAPTHGQSATAPLRQVDGALKLGPAAAALSSSTVLGRTIVASQPRGISADPMR